MAVWYCRDNSTFGFEPNTTATLVPGSLGWSAMTGWAASTLTAAGTLIRQSAGTASFTAGQSATTLTVAAGPSGTIYLGMSVLNSGGTLDSHVTAFGTGSGGAGTYTVSGSQTVSAGTSWQGGFLNTNPRAFVAIVAGTTNTTEPNWTITKGAKTTDNTVTWMECTGQPGVNGDITNAATWPTGTAVALGFMIYDSTSAALQIVSTAGTTGGSKPTFSATAGTVTSDGATVKWTSLGLASGFAAWDAPFALIADVFGTSWAVAGDSVYLGNDHLEASGGAINSYNFSPTGTNAAPNFIYSIDHTLSLPVSGSGLKAGATISTRAGIGLYLAEAVSSGASVYFYGVSFIAGSSSTTASILIGDSSVASWTKLDTCTLQLNNTSSSSLIQFGGGTATCLVELLNTTMQFGATGQAIGAVPNGKLIWRNTASAIVGATLPTTLFNTTSSGVVICEGVDLSALGSGKTLVPAGTAAANSFFHFFNCALGASVTIAATPGSMGGPFVDAILCDSGATGYVQRRYWYQGTLQEETTVVRSGGASDGITPISWKIVTTANSRWTSPFESFPISIWNSRTAATVTVTVYGIWGSGAVPNTDDIWIDVEYLGSSSTPLASLGSGTKANNLATGTAWATDSSSWGGSTTAFKMSVSLSSPQPQIAGYLHIYVKAAKASSTFYIDPLPVLS
jgi:hypothetical protein